MRLKMLFIYLLVAATNSYSYNGTVQDPNGTAIPYVKITHSETSQSTLSDSLGNFSLDIAVNTKSIGHLNEFFFADNKINQLVLLDAKGKVLENLSLLNTSIGNEDFTKWLSPYENQMVFLQIHHTNSSIETLPIHPNSSIPQKASHLKASILNFLTLEKEGYPKLDYSISNSELDLGIITLPFYTLDQITQLGILGEGINNDQITTKILNLFEAQLEFKSQSLNQLFPIDSNENILWYPSVHSMIMENLNPSNNIPILTSNAVWDTAKTIYNKPFGYLGKRGLSETNYMILGGNPYYQVSKNENINDDLKSFLKRSLLWLTKNNLAQVDSPSVIITHMKSSDYSAVKEWILLHYPDAKINSETECLNDSLKLCIDQKDPLLLITAQDHATDGQEEVIVNAIKYGMSKEIPFLYLHHKWDMLTLGNKILAEFELKYQWNNYFKTLGLKDYQNEIIDSNPSSIERLITHLSLSDYDIPWDQCDDENCDTISLLKTDFRDGVDELKQLIESYDKNAINIFDTENNETLKLIILLAESYRDSIHYPMDKDSTDTNEFLRAFFADHIIHYSRTQSKAQPDLGNFSTSDFSQVARNNKTISLESKKNFRAAGVYAFPGETFKVTRLDNSEITTKIFVNTQRSGSTHQYANYGYSRPKYLSSTKIKLKIGESVQITSPYGGPIQIEFSDNGYPTEFTFENIGLHPIWRSSADDEAFTSALEKGEFNWVEVITPGFEVHSSLDKFKKSLNEEFDTPQKLATATEKYVHNLPHLLAGFKGPGIDSATEINSFAKEHQLEIQFIDIVKHMNADQATCGSGCSGNPYDAYWSFNPIGHGDIHELGHGLQKGIFQFGGLPNHAFTNYYSYFTKYNYHQSTGNDPSCQSLPFTDLYATLQLSQAESDPTQYMRDQNITEWNQGAAMMIQLMMLVQNQGALENGWFLLSRIHLLEREFQNAKKSQENWDLAKFKMGMELLTLEEAKSISNNDWMLLALSWSSERDFLSYLEMWGMEFSTLAKTQLASYNFTSLPKLFMKVEGSDFCLNFDTETLPIDGQSIWP